MATQIVESLVDERNGDVTTTDLNLHRIANQWGYNLASRSMDLQAVAFPALVAADDG